MVTLGARDSGRDNNLNLLRFCAASLVVLLAQLSAVGSSAAEPLAKRDAHLRLRVDRRHRVLRDQRLPRRA
jgi:hypothetical protein